MATRYDWPIERFTVTEDHVKLVRCLNIRFDEGVEWGGPAADFKRPFGNGDLFGDMRSILGRQHIVIDDEEPDRAELDQLYRELGTVLAIFVRTGELRAGEFETPQYHSDWRPTCPTP